MIVRFASAFLFAGLAVTAASAGTIYEVTAKQGGDTVTYKVKFGGAKLVEQWTAYDPASKRFVYLTWKRGEAAPVPAATIWDHKTGETVKLYRFPDVANPLPVIPTIQDMKVCPVTGDKAFSSKRVGNYD
jgi:hypothetical protein